ncbi:MAG: penicillin-binding protein 2 [Porticoccus sp.]|jgi:penicillin-binding protein 2
MDNYHPFKSPQFERQQFRARLFFGTSLMVVLASILLGRYYYLQVIKYEEFMTKSESNRVLVEPIAPTRGLIYDRNGVLLAQNRTSFSLSVVIERADDLGLLLEEISSLITLSDKEKSQFYKQLNRRRRPFESILLKMDLSEEEQAILAVNQYYLQGSLVTAKLSREYPFGQNFAHALGYVGRINDREVDTLDPVLYRGTLVLGKTGLEKKYEDDLLGRVGYQTIEVNNRGRMMRLLQRENPIDGKDLHLYLDHRLQHQAYGLLKGEKGAIVVIEIDTGGVLAMVSAPSFDPNEFVSGISHKSYSELTHSSGLPLFDRALRGQYPPGSTVKPVYGLAALDEGVIDENYRISDPGYFKLPNSEHKYRDWKKGGHGNNIHLHDAIVQSCDTFFYNLTNLMSIDTFDRYGSAFGLGQKTGIDMPLERKGIMPSRSWKQKDRGMRWYTGDTVNVSIGQGYTLTTPMQLAVMTAGIASRGEIRTPQLVQHQQNILPVKRKIEISESHWNYVHQSMEDVVHGPKGTARGISKGLSYNIAGKTGTVQVINIKQEEKYDAESTAKRNRDHALFIAFAPRVNPKIAVAIVIENAGSGSSQAAPVARKIMDAYMNFYPETSGGYDDPK